MTAPAPPHVPAVNEVHLRGRLSATPTIRTLPSGAQVGLFRLVVAREVTHPSHRVHPSAAAGADGVRRRPTVDTLDCAVWDESMHSWLAGCEPGLVLEVHGSLRRRFWRSPTGASSRYEVEVSQLQECPPGQSPTGRSVT